MKNDTKALNRYGMNEITAAKQLTHEVAVDNINDPNATFGEKFVAGAWLFCLYESICCNGSRHRNRIDSFWQYNWLVGIYLQGRANSVSNDGVSLLI